MFSPRPTLNKRVRGQSSKSRQVSTDRKDNDISGVNLLNRLNSNYKITSHRMIILKERTIESDQDKSLSARNISTELLNRDNFRQ